LFRSSQDDDETIGEPWLDSLDESNGLKYVCIRELEAPTTLQGVEELPQGTLEFSLGLVSRTKGDMIFHGHAMAKTPGVRLLALSRF